MEGYMPAGVVGHGDDPSPSIVTKGQVGSAIVGADLIQVPACVVGVVPTLPLRVGKSNQPPAFIEEVNVPVAVRHRIMNRRSGIANESRADAGRDVIRPVCVFVATK